MLAGALLLFCLLLSPCLSLIYSYSVRFLPGSATRYGWGDVAVTVHNLTLHETLLSSMLPVPGALSPAALVRQPVFMSLTVMSTRLHRAHRAVLCLLQGYIVPTRIYLFVSFEPYLLDEGVSVLPRQLLTLCAAGLLQIVFTANIGPHRKLLPLLDRYHAADVLLVTVDDDLGLVRNSTLLFRLLQTHLLSLKQAEGKHAIAALRSRRIGLCLGHPPYTTSYRYWSLSNTILGNEQLTVPTGTGGILYHPSQLHEVVFDPKLREITGSADDLMFRLASMAKNASVLLGCVDCAPLTDAQLAQGAIQQLKPMPVAAVQYAVQFEFIPGSGTNASYSALLDDLSASGVLPLNRIVDKSFNRSKPVNSLFAMNRRGLNDQAWNDAVRYLKELGVVDVRRVIAEHYTEREEVCYSAPEVRRGTVQCGVWPC